MSSAEWKAFSRMHLKREDWSSNAAAYGYALARSIVQALESSGDLTRCELDVVRLSNRNWDIVESGIPCERSQPHK